MFPEFYNEYFVTPDNFDGMAFYDELAKGGCGGEYRNGSDHKLDEYYDAINLKNSNDDEYHYNFNRNDLNDVDSNKFYGQKIVENLWCFQSFMTKPLSPGQF